MGNTKQEARPHCLREATQQNCVSMRLIFWYFGGVEQLVKMAALTNEMAARNGCTDRCFVWLAGWLAGWLAD